MMISSAILVLATLPGLGMAPFLINHPLLINQWIEQRETALARAKMAGADGIDSHMLRADSPLPPLRVIQHLGEICYW